MVKNIGKPRLCSLTCLPSTDCIFIVTFPLIFDRLTLPSTVCGIIYSKGFCLLRIIPRGPAAINGLMRNVAQVGGMFGLR